MNKLQIFSNQEFGTIRTTEINGEPINFAEGHGRLPKQQSWASSIRDSVLRSKTFPGVAKAMAEQWGDYLREEEEK